MQPPQPTAADLASFATYQAWFKRIAGFATPEAELRQTMESAADGSVGRSRTPPSVAQAVLEGMKKYTDIRAPALAIYADPHDLGPIFDPGRFTNNRDAAMHAALEAYSAYDAVSTEKQAKAFEEGVPGARVVRLPHANHVVLLSNEADVLREMRAFLATLK